MDKMISSRQHRVRRERSGIVLMAAAVGGEVAARAVLGRGDWFGPVAIAVSSICIGASMWIAGIDEWQKRRALYAIGAAFGATVIWELVQAVWAAAAARHVQRPTQVLWFMAVAWILADAALRALANTEGTES